MSCSYDYLSNQFLISMPHLSDQHFSQTIVYLCDHSEYGAMGLIINQPSGIRLTELCEHLELDLPTSDHQQHTIYNGGPVRTDRGFVLHTNTNQVYLASSYNITDSLYLSTAVDAVEAAAKGNFGQDYFIALGCASWGAGQLESEIADNVWLSCPANEDILFSSEKNKPQAAASLLGINLELLTSHAGHA